MAKNYLTEEQINMLKKAQASSQNVTMLEKLQAICNHRDISGNDTLIADQDGTRCTICGRKIKTVDIDHINREYLEGLCKDMTSIVDTIKIMYHNMSPQVAEEFCLLIPLLKRVPDMWDRAIENGAPLIPAIKGPMFTGTDNAVKYQNYE